MVGVDPPAWGAFENPGGLLARPTPKEAFKLPSFEWEWATDWLVSQPVGTSAPTSRRECQCVLLPGPALVALHIV